MTSLLQNMYFILSLFAVFVHFIECLPYSRRQSQYIVYSSPITNYNRFIKSESNDSNNPEIYIRTYGGDPTGIKDSTNAFQSALNEAMTRGIKNATLDGSIHDCGGATINLQGGIYLISSPLWTDGNNGNFRIIDGTIKASNSFKSNSNSTSFLLSVWGPSQDVGLENLFFDCNNQCDGTLLIDNCVGAVVGPQNFFMGFNVVGIRVVDGHEVNIYNTWIGQYVWNDPRRPNATATGIQLYGNDHFIDNVVIWSGKIGIEITGAANIITGVHTYNLANNLGGIGILVNTYGQLRFIGCYFDYNDIVLVAPIQLISIQDTFFLGAATVVLQSNEDNASINGLSIVDSQFVKGSAKGDMFTVTLDEKKGKFGDINNVFMENMMMMNANGGYKLKTTKYSMKLSLVNATQWVFDFSDVLLFDMIGIESIDYTFQLDGDMANKFDYQHVLTKPNGMKVVIYTSYPCAATVYVTVDQSKHT